MLKELMEDSELFNRKKSMGMHGILFHIIFSVENNMDYSLLEAGFS